MIENIPVRFFIVDFDSEEYDYIEVSESEFIQAEGRIRYERHTVRENGVSQVCLKKWID